MPQKIIIDTDPGIDDAMAIHMAFADPRLEVVGLTAVFGNVTGKQATRNALCLAEMAHYPAAVAGGAETPMTREPQPPADFVHGPEGFGTLPAMRPTRMADTRNAARYLVETCAEANIWNDPHAADAVFAADWDVTMVGLDVTEKTQCIPADFEAIAAQSPVIGSFLNEATGFYFDFHEAKTGTRSCFMHDPSAIMAITDPELFSFENTPISVVCEGEEIGRTVTGADGRRPVRVAMDVDSDAARRTFIELTRQADTVAGARRA